MKLVLTLGIPFTVPPLWDEIFYTCCECKFSVQFNIRDENDVVFHSTYQCLKHHRHYKGEVVEYKPCNEFRSIRERIKL